MDEVPDFAKRAFEGMDPQVLSSFLIESINLNTDLNAAITLQGMLEKMLRANKQVIKQLRKNKK